MTHDVRGRSARGNSWLMGVLGLELWGKLWAVMRSLGCFFPGRGAIFFRMVFIIIGCPRKRCSNNEGCPRVFTGNITAVTSFKLELDLT